MIEFLGTVTSGMGNGQKFMSKKHYSNEFQRILGWKPFAGTLNLILDEPIDIENIFCSDKLEVTGFIERKEDGNIKERGSVKVKFIEIISKKDFKHKMNAAIVLPAKTMHTNVIEVIAASELRKIWNLKDGDKVIIRCEEAQFNF